jgi:homocysteine S-methyltransferase
MDCFAMTAATLFDPFLAGQGVVVLDGALATELERRGALLNDALWSARLLADNPDLIRQVHDDYLRAGADVLTTASYQATFAGFARRGLSHDEAAALMRRSVEIALAARDDFWADPANRVRRQRPLVAASVGPYGAFLADGSEYRGDYGLSIAELKDFHRPRMAVLAASGADLLACETIPCAEEGEALVQLLAEFAPLPAWLSFSCRSGSEVSDGGLFAEAAALADRSDQIAAVGVNCTAPRYIEDLLRAAAGATAKPLLCYPNSGEAWDPLHNCWVGSSGVTDFCVPAMRWRAAGASLIGGCCRTTPDDVRAIRRSLNHDSWD